MPARAHTIADAGTRIGTKEGRALGVGDLDQMSPAEADALVRKDAVWPPPDWRDLVAAGMEPRAAALVKLIRDRLPSRPNLAVHQLGTPYTERRLRAPELIRRDYVRMMATVRDALATCRTVDDVRQARAAILEAVDWRPSAGAEIRHLVSAVHRDRLDTLQVDYRDLAKAEVMVREGWPGAPTPTWRKGHVVRGDGDGGFMLAKGVKIIADSFKTEEAAWDWLRREVEGRRASQIQAAMPARLAPAQIVRVGLPDRRNGGDVPVLGFLDTFGLRAVEFGKWVPQNERQRLLNQTYDALHDLADAVGLPPDAIGLGGFLALSFGARASGPAGADYDPGLTVIALPRGAGAGELAHGWGHALDHWTGEVGLTERPPSPRLASGVPGARTGAAQPQTEQLDPAEARAWERVSTAIWRNDGGVGDEIAALKADIAKREREVAEAEAQRAAFLGRTPGAADTPAGARYLDDLDRWLRARRDSILPGLRGKLATLHAQTTTEESAYAKEARKLCGRVGDFWARPSEMFARAFECYVHDQLAARVARNDFLVCGVEQHRFASGYRGNPYPTGAERHRINAAMADLVAAMMPRLTAPAPEPVDALKAGGPGTDTPTAPPAPR